MKRINHFIILSIVILLLFQITTYSQESKENPLTHAVICWLHQETSEKEINLLIKEIKKLNSIPGIVDLQVGRSIDSEREIVDDSFSIAITMKFNSIIGMKSYLSHKDHVKFVNEILKPKLTKIVVYDFEN